MCDNKGVGSRGCHKKMALRGRIMSLLLCEGFTKRDMRGGAVLWPGSNGWHPENSTKMGQFDR